MQLVPLGGDGFVSPHSVYYLNSIRGEGDASGGTNEVLVRLDTRYQCICTNLRTLNTGAAATVEVRMTISAGQSLALSHNSIGLWTDVDDVSRGSWAPPLIFDATHISLKTANVDGDDLLLTALVYCFNKEASQRVPLAQLLASIPRSENATN